MSRLSEFKEFYLKTVLPNTPSYKSLFNEYCWCVDFKG